MKANPIVLLRPMSVALLLAVLFLTSCTRTTNIRMLQPADMKLPEHISTMATVDRSKPSSGFTTVLEGIFSGESIGQDRRGRERAVSGVNDALSQTPRLQLKTTGMEMEGSKGGVNMALPIPWETIEEICRTYQTDAVLAIESYDSNVNAHTERYNEKYKDKEGNEQIRVRWRAEANANVKVGWRLYDPKLKVILDEHTTFASGSFTGNGDTERAAQNDLPDLAYAVFDMSFDAGRQYGMRVAPVWITVSRPYFTKGKKPFKEDMQRATRLTDQGRWEEALEIWTALEQSADPKTAGRAAHNIAVAHERLGLLTAALEWADRAFLLHGNKTSRSYADLLRLRIEDAKRVDYQMNSNT